MAICVRVWVFYPLIDKLSLFSLFPGLFFPAVTAQSGEYLKPNYRE